jgi:GPH family glycoside/pentoside/hexuronide:cation symporter
MRDISTARLIAYALPSVPLSMLGMMIVVYMPQFYAAEIGLELAALGGIFFLARLWDAVIDPVIGNWSDRTRTKWGRRKPWVACGLPFLLLSFWYFTMPPANSGLSYLLLVTFCFYIAYTLVNIPYLSWGAELSRDYAQRTRINGFREAGTMVGVILATSIPLYFLAGTNPTPRDIVTVFSYAFLIIMPIAVFAALFLTPQGGDIAKTEPLTFFKSLNLIRRNRPFMLLLLSMFLIWVGGGIYNATSFFLATFALGVKPEYFLWLLLLQYVVGIVFMPLHVWLGSRIGKHKTLLFVGMAFFVVLPLLAVVEPGNMTEIVIVYALKGAVTASIWVMPPALVADTIEYGLEQGAGDDTALYMSLYFFIQKAAMAVGVGVALPLAAAQGFDPKMGPEAVVDGLKFVSVILPFFVALPATWILYKYPITQAVHDAIRERLAQRGVVSERG